MDKNIPRVSGSLTLGLAPAARSTRANAATRSGRDRPNPRGSHKDRREMSSAQSLDASRGGNLILSLTTAGGDRRSANAEIIEQRTR
jgi:hypothetical protein